ncbi:2-oxo acid dehydrogenase subunit E2 [bacterium]|nr:2-oxo acid dehydrogenase subunit E2 [bacterium]
MGTYVFKLPDIGEGIAEAEIAEWRVAVGDMVEEDQPIVDMLTDKAAVEVPAPTDGKIVKLHGEPGDMVPVSSALITMEVEGDGNAIDADVDIRPAEEADPEPDPEPDTQPKAESAQEPSAPAVPDQKPASKPAQKPSRKPAGRTRPAGDKPLASPAVRRRARDEGIRLAYLQGTGPAGQITHADLDEHLASGQIAGPAATGLVQKTGVEDIKIIGIRRKIAERMQDAKQRIPHFAYVEEIDLTELEALRKHMNTNRRDDQPKLTLLPFLMKAIVQAVPHYPQVNSNYDDAAGVVHQFEGVHIGIATQTKVGLTVPVVRHAEARDMWDSAAEVKRLADAARAGQATKDELSGSTITITSLGALGGIVTTPVINSPEVAIIGVNKLVEKPVVIDGQIAIRKTMNLSSSFDHRIVDGYDAALFIQKIKGLLEFPATLFTS